MSALTIGVRYARRELRGGVRGLRIVLACLALGVAAITAIGTLRAAIQAGLEQDGARILGGDVEVSLGGRPVPAEALAWMRARARRFSEVVAMRAMAVAPSGERSLVELKAVDHAYPLYGQLVLDPPGPLLDGEVAVERVVAERLGVPLGGMLRIGEASFTLRGIIEQEPDRVARPAIMGPRAMIALDSLPDTQLVQPGSLLAYEYRLRLETPAEGREFAAALRAAFPEEGFRIRRADAAVPGVNRFVDRAASFLTLAGLTALLVGGIGVGTGVRAWLDQRARTIATLRCLGAPAGALFATYLFQVLALSLAGILLGLVVGYALTWFAAETLESALPVPPRLGLYAAPLAMAALYGLLTAIAFALWPLGRAREIPGGALFRDMVAPADRRPRAWLVATTFVAAAALAALVVITSDNPRFACWFVGGAVATLLAFRCGALALMALARRCRGLRRPALRLGLANLHRPGAPTPLMLLALGIGLTTLAAIALIDANLRREIGEQMPEAAPNFYFIDIQPDQAQAFDALARSLPGVSEVQRVPNLRARIVALKDVPVERVAVREDTAWALRGDRGLTYAAQPPEGTHIVAGAWWPSGYRGPPLVSLDANLARGWGVTVGDSITVNVLGRNIPLRIASLRDVEWRSLGINYTLIASPGMLEAAPHTHIATIRAEVAQEGQVLRALTDAFPNISGIRVRDALEAIATLISRIGAALSATASLTLIAGVLVLAGAMAATQRRRVRDAVILKTLGATRAQIRAAWLVEFGLLGLTAGAIAAAAGTLAAWGVVRFVMNADWEFMPGTLAVVVVACTVLTLACGYAGTALALRAKPAPWLRNE